MNNGNKFQNNNEDIISENEGLYPSVQKSITKIAEKEGYICPKIYKKKVSADGGNCFGSLYEINIKGETIDGNNQETNLFVKQMVPNVEHIKLLSVSEIYNKEVFIYTELAKIFEELQDKANIPMTRRFKFVKIYDENNIDALILENMTKQEFKTYGRTDTMKLNYAKLCIEHLAKFHGLAFLIEKIMPEYFESKIKPIKQSLCTDDTYKVFANKIYKHATRKLPADLIFKTDKWWENAIDNYLKYLQGTMTTVKCLCHGDFKSNNVMYKEQDGEIKEVIAVDYQLAHYGSPILDLIYFICMGSDQKFRRKHLNHIKDHYYDSLEKFLEYYDVLVDDVYPRKMFDNDFENCLDYALVSCVCVLPFSLYTEGGVPDFIDNNMVHIGIKFDDAYYDRLKEAFEDFLKSDP